MAKTNNHASFSFALSETPPPTRSSEGTPLGDLDLDLGEFGELSSESQWAHEPGVVRAPRGFEGSDFTPRVENPLAKVELSALHADQGETPDLQPFALSPVAPQVNEQTVDPLQKTALVQAPLVKKIQFPRVQSAEAPTPTEPLKKGGEERIERETTRFSSSIAARGPRSRLGSDPEVASLRPGDSEVPDDAESSSLALPEDLPVALTPGQPSEPRWASETPSAREIWKTARKVWGATSRQAVALGGQGLRAGRQLAKETNDRLRESLERNAAALEEGTASDDPAAEQVSPTPPRAPLSGAPITGRVILGLARSTTKRLAAPLSALAAAALVYWGGTALLGTTGAVPLSKSAGAAKIPDLGTIAPGVDGVQNTQDGAAKGSSPGAQGTPLETTVESADGKPATMQVEVAEMPEGLSWPGKGLIEVVTSEEELIYVDGVFTGRGPLRRIPVSPGEHELSIRSGGLERTGKVQVTENKNTRAVFTLR